MRHLISLALALALALVTTQAAAAPPRAVDGDTLAVDGERVRLLGIDAPELHGRCGAEKAAARAAQAALARLVAPPARLSLQRHGRDRYGRTLARVLADGRDVAATLLAAGHARPYAGGRRPGWCQPSTPEPSTPEPRRTK